MDSEKNDLNDKNINLEKYKLFNLKQEKSKFFFIIWLLFFIFFVYILLYKNTIIIINKSNIKELISFLNNKNEISKNFVLSNYNYNVYSDNINDKLKMLRLITNNNYVKYEGIENCLLHDPDNQYCIYHLISPKKVFGKERILIGEINDGSYVLLNDFKDIRIAYSFGIANIIQFDKGLADRGIDVYMYDHTINKLPYNNSKFHWEKIGIAGKKNENAQLKTLEHLIQKNGHSSEKNMILKIDVEDHEWESLINLPENILKQFKYIVIEYHFLNDNVELYYNVIKKLYKNHQIFYLRCHGRENFAIFGNNIICKYLEASYVIREGNLFEKDDTIYPIFEFDLYGPNPNSNIEINLNILKLFSN